MDDSGTAHGAPRRPPLPVRVAGVGVAVEALVVVVLAGVLLGIGVLGAPDDRSGTVLAGLLGLALGAGLVAVGLALYRGRGWAWSPAVLLQVFLTVVTVSLLRAGDLVLALVPGVLVLLVGYQLATPQARAVSRARE